MSHGARASTGAGSAQAHTAVSTVTPLLPRLVQDGEVWVADPGRPLAPSFLAAAKERWAVVETLPTRQHDVRIHRLQGPRG